MVEVVVVDVDVLEVVVVVVVDVVVVEVVVEVVSGVDSLHPVLVHLEAHSSRVEPQGTLYKQHPKSQGARQL